MNQRELLQSIDRFDRLEILVIGDFFVDEYLEGEMYEISREGPIPVLRFESMRSAAGAAGNLASSIRNLGARVRVVGLAGSDARGRALREELSGKGIDIAGLLDSGEPTFTYTKYRARVASAPSREILRVDVLPDGLIAPELEERLLETIQRRARDVQGIILLDQIRHLVSPKLIAELPGIAREAGALLHGSSREHVGEFRNFDLVIPNDHEAAHALDLDPETTEPEVLGPRLRDHGQHRQVLLTLGPEGMLLVPHSGELSRVPTLADEVLDVTGCGDAVASTAMLANASGWKLEDLARVASHSAAIAIGKIGTHHVTREELCARLEN